MAQLPTRHSIVISLISLGLVVLFVYLILKSLITAAIPVGIALAGMMFKIFRDWSNEKIDHSKRLVDKELKFRTGTYIDFEDNHSLQLRIKKKGTRSFDAPDYENYSNEVDAHLESGHKEVWKHRKVLDSLINDHNSLAKHLLNAYKEKIIREINKKNTSLIEWNGTDQPRPIKYFITERLSIDFGYALHDSYERPFDIDQYCVVYQDNNKWKLKVNLDFAESDNENEMKEINQIIKAAFNDVIASEDFRKLKTYRKNSEKEHSFYVSGINEIIKRVDNDNPLNGRCPVCP